MTSISIIAAIDKHRGLGRDNKLMWHIPEDMKRFITITSGHPVIMGRKTFESIGKPLPRRTNIIVTKDMDYHFQGSTTAHSLPEAIAIAKKLESQEIFIIGGAQIYTQALPFADTLYLTVINSVFDADVFFPDYSVFKQVISREKRSTKDFSYTFLTLRK